MTCTPWLHPAFLAVLGSLLVGLGPSVAWSAVEAAPGAAAARPSTIAPAAEARFDLSVNNAPAAQVFLQLASGTPYNMLVAPDVSGSLSVTLKNTTVPEAMDTLRELFGFDYRITGNRIFVYPNTVQTRLYRINYLPGRRQGASDIRVTSSAISLSGAGTQGTSGSGSGSSSSERIVNAEPINRRITRALSTMQ